jgi:hypothetical protein
MRMEFTTSRYEVSDVPGAPISNQSCVDRAALHTWEDDGGRVPRIGRAVRRNAPSLQPDEGSRSFARLGVRTEGPSAGRRGA